MFKQATESRVAVFFADGLEECEALILTDLLFRAGIPCDKVAIADNLAVTSSHETTVVCNRTLSDEGFSFDDYDVLVLPGGIPGTPNLKACGPLCQALSAFVESGRTVAAICAAPSILAELGLLRGRTATSNPSFMHVLEENGATLVEDPVAVDGNVITSRGLGTALDLGLELVRRLRGNQVADDIKKAIVYRA